VDTVVSVQVPGPLKLTLPVGAIGVPPSLSVTVAVHVVASPMLIVLGEQEIDVEVERLLTVQLNVVLPEAPTVSVALTVTVLLPAALGVPEMSPVLGLIVRPLGSPVAE
jgi:hypothetical protein